MYLFNRARRAHPSKLLEAMGSAVEIAGKVNQITGLEISVWSVRFGRPAGTIMWSARLDSQAQLFEANEKMMADATYMDMVMSMNELYEGTAEDRMASVISGAPAEAPSKYVVTMEATMANGKYAEAIEFGVAMQEFGHSELDAPNMFAAATYGGFADVVWLTGFDTPEQLDAGHEWQMTNPEFHERVKGAAGLFVEGSGAQGLIERIN
ncbi:MAG: hypothetical protein QNJ12_10580 [Ilumatobacter sp.]|uniref:hypothetical protein n=1 Tax=Ilumatobacter sp. TaxID=1967498 RepID=UPI00260E7079|nr:hypothetical protein [Ilumatobacter sp.]MDJ0769233.1 hypothetical protein [Ilumatobacter sp.]